MIGCAPDQLRDLDRVQAQAAGSDHGNRLAGLYAGDIDQRVVGR
jgi:hypothetical protein